MFDFLKKSRNPEEIARKITEEIADSAFKFYRSEKFRSFTDLKNLEKTEQDRIFNELIANGLAVGILIFGTMAEKTKSERAKIFYHELMIELSSRYGNWLKELETPKHFCDMWKELIQMRVDEYIKDCQEHEKEIGDPFKRNPWVFVVAIGCHRHIRRGKTKPDELFKPILHWILDTADIISKIMFKSI